MEGGCPGGEPPVNKGAVLSPDSLKYRLLESQRKNLVGTEGLPQRTGGWTDGSLEQREYQVQSCRSSILGRTWPSPAGTAVF